MLSIHNLLPWYLYLVFYFNENSQVLVNAIILILTVTIFNVIILILTVVVVNVIILILTVTIVRLHNIVMESITVIHMYHRVYKYYKLSGL